MKTFDKIEDNKVKDVPFPNSGKPTRRRSVTNNKIRNSNNQDGQGTNIERLNSVKEKARGPVLIQYTLTSGLKIKYSDGRPIEGSANGNSAAAPQRRGSAAYSLGSAND